MGQTFWYVFEDIQPQNETLYHIFMIYIWAKTEQRFAKNLNKISKRVDFAASTINNYM